MPIIQTAVIMLTQVKMQHGLAHPGTEIMMISAAPQISALIIMKAHLPLRIRRQQPGISENTTQIARTPFQIQDTAASSASILGSIAKPLSRSKPAQKQDMTIPIPIILTTLRSGAIGRHGRQPLTLHRKQSK